MYCTVKGIVVEETVEVDSITCTYNGDNSFAPNNVKTDSQHTDNVTVTSFNRR